MEYITLSNGVEMPVVGFGVYQIVKEDCERCVLDAIDVGYRSFDTAQCYYNEEQVGNAVKKSGIPREEFFLTTKVWIGNYGYESTRESVLGSLRKLKTDYLDLCLLHKPYADYHGAYRALESLYREGVIRAIGVSNFYPDRIVDLSLFAAVKPMVNQIEMHPHYQRRTDKEWLDKYGIKAEAWAPFGEGRGGLFQNETISDIAKSYNKTTAQVMIRWHIQNGNIVIPKSVHKERMIENISVFDFDLSAEDMGKIAAIDKDESSFFSHSDPAIVEWYSRLVEERKSK